MGGDNNKSLYLDIFAEHSGESASTKMTSIK